MRVHVGRDVVLPAHLDRVESELPRRPVHHGLHHREGDGMADGAVLAHGRLVLEDHAQGGGVIAEAVDARSEPHGLVPLDGARARVHRVGADAREIVHAHAADGSVAHHGQLGLHPVLTRVDVAHEGLEAVGGELDGPAQHHAERAGRHLVWVDMHLDSEASPHVLADDADVVLGQVQVPRENVLHHVGRLERVVHGQPPLRGVEISEDGPRLEGDPGVATHGEGLVEHGVGLREGAVGITRGEVEAEREVVAELRMDDRRRRIEGGLGIGGGGQRPPLDAHTRDAVLGDGPALRHHGGHRLALPRGLARGERALERRLHSCEVSEGADPAGAHGRHVLARHHRGHPRKSAGAGGIDRSDARVSVRAPHEGHVEHAREDHVVGEDAATGEEARGLRPDHALPDVAPALIDAGRHRCPFSSTPRSCVSRLPSRDSRCTGSSYRRAPRESHRVRRPGCARADPGR